METVKKLGPDAIREIQAEFQAQLRDDEKMEKQSISLSIVLTADRIATDYLFQDGQYIPLEEAKRVLISREELSENERAYEYILSEVEININKFKPDSFSGDYKGEVWGCIENGYVIIQPNAFSRICEKGNFSKKSFLSWASKKNLIAMQGDSKTKNKKFFGKAIRCICVKMPDDDGFEEITEDERLPF